jgi:hypothetical protein
MTAAGTDDARAVSVRQPSPLATRLALAFLAVPLGALAVLTVVTLLSARGGFTELTAQQQQAALQRTAALAAAAYEQADGWEDADLHAAVAVGAAEVAEVTVRDLEGRAVPIGPMAAMPDMPGVGGADMQEMMRRMHGPPGETGPPSKRPSSSTERRSAACSCASRSTTPRVRSCSCGTR